MSTMRILAALLAALLSLSCAAAPYTVRLGIEKIVLDAPPGFTDTTELASPRLQDLSETLTAASNRILLFALADADVRKFTLGEQLDARRYMIAVTPKGLERERLSPAQLAAYIADSVQNLGKPVKAPDLIRYLETQPIGRASLLAELKREPTIVSVLQATRLPVVPGKRFFDSDTPQYLVFTTTIFVVRGKAIQLAVYSLYDTPADIDWLKLTTDRWVDDLQRLNR
jgi:hypothetical protein